jgi:hypothetical protein
MSRSIEKAPAHAPVPERPTQLPEGGIQILLPSLAHPIHEKSETEMHHQNGSDHLGGDAQPRKTS